MVVCFRVGAAARMCDFILVCGEEGGEPSEVSVEEDGSVELDSIAAAFPGTTSIKYRNPATQVPANSWKIQISNNIILVVPPRPEP